MSSLLLAYLDACGKPTIPPPHYRGRARIVQISDGHAIDLVCGFSSRNAKMNRSKRDLVKFSNDKEDSISKIENFLRFFIQGVYDIPTSAKPLRISMGAPRSKDRETRVRWKFPSESSKDMKQWGTVKL